MFSTLYICCSAGDAVKRPLEAQGDRPRRLGESESNLLFAFGLSAHRCFILTDRKRSLVPDPSRGVRPAGPVSIPALALRCGASSRAAGVLQRAGGTTDPPPPPSPGATTNPGLRMNNAGPGRRESGSAGRSGGSRVAAAPAEPGGELPRGGEMRRHLPSNAVGVGRFAVARQNEVPLFRFGGWKRSR